MAEHDFKVGDLVRLKSGGPLMTYSGDAQFGGALCVWFEGNKKFAEQFDHAIIEKSSKPPVGVVGVRRS
ncbi:YodC family protein [Paracoccus sphaerophysae]|uniref:YodC family protein n=1 Tax=Paracoccus sphaerophysae TaxID=690417 RepID=UPI0005635D08|nr:DUF2158 domain-containing protein [Paracoccus sphaerophysae]